MSKLPYNALLSEKDKSCTLDCGCEMHRPYADSGEPGDVAITFCKRHDAAGAVHPKDLSVAALHIALDTFLSQWEGNPVDVLEALESDVLPSTVIIWEPMEIRSLPEIAACVDGLKRQILTMLRTELGIEV